MKQRLVALALVAVAHPAWTSQLRSDAEIRNILAERLEGFEKSVDAIFTFDFAKDDQRVANQLMFHWGFLSPRVGTRIE